MKRDLAKVKMIDCIEKFFDECDDELGRQYYLADETANLMAVAALSVLFAVEDVQEYLTKEEIM